MRGRIMLSSMLREPCHFRCGERVSISCAHGVHRDPIFRFLGLQTLRIELLRLACVWYILSYVSVVFWGPGDAVVVFRDYSSDLLMLTLITFA